ncbi:hypothetical protein, partial [Aeromonas veronii]|uniref:hypothetical protein n=1 Tax=Aeromonas veronii TaxID=654 RepID=UPI0038B4A39C
RVEPIARLTIVFLVIVHVLLHTMDMARVFARRPLITSRAPLVIVLSSGDAVVLSLKVNDML